MARPIKKGLDYFPLDVDFFQGKKIKTLKARYGVDGISIYLYLLCDIYKDGYYISIDDDFIYIMADDLRMKPNKVKQVLNFLLERSLFDGKLFQSDKILTSTGIQRRFQLAVKERAKKKPIEVLGGYWLLKKDETEPFIKVSSFLNKSKNNDNKSKKNEYKSQEKFIKERKVKESKVDVGGGKNSLSPEEKEILVQIYGATIVEDYINRTTQYHCCNYDMIKKWIEEDSKQKIRGNSLNKPISTNRIYTTDEIKNLEKKLLENG